MLPAALTTQLHAGCLSADRASGVWRGVLGACGESERHESSRRKLMRAHCVCRRAWTWAS